MTFSAQMHRMAERKLPFERLVVDASLALQIFQVSYIYTKSKSITARLSLHSIAGKRIQSFPNPEYRGLQQ